MFSDNLGTPSQLIRLLKQITTNYTMYTITLLSGGVRSFSVVTYSIEYSKAMLKPWEYTQHYGYTVTEIQQCLCEPLEPYDYMTGFAKPSM